MKIYTKNEIEQAIDIQLLMREILGGVYPGFASPLQGIAQPGRVWLLSVGTSTMSLFQS